MASEPAVVGSSQSQGYVAEKIGELSLLLDISQTLDSSMDLRDTLVPVLEIIAKYKGIVRGSLTLLNRGSGEISIETAYGLSPSQQRRGRYRIGEGIIGQVFQTGKPAIIPKVAEEPRLVISKLIIRAGRANSECRDHRDDQGNSPAHPRPRRANPVTAAPPGYYVKYSKRETWLFRRPRNAAGTSSSPGAGRETD